MTVTITIEYAKLTYRDHDPIETKLFDENGNRVGSVKVSE